MTVVPSFASVAKVAQDFRPRRQPCRNSSRVWRRKSLPLTPGRHPRVTLLTLSPSHFYTSVSFLLIPCGYQTHLWPQTPRRRIESFDDPNMSRHKHDRHELQTNELAVYLGRINRAIEPYSKAIAVAVGLLIVGGIGWGLYRAKVSGNRSDATLNLLNAVDSSSAEQLAFVSDSYPKTAAAAWSRLYEGNAFLAEGLGALYVNREDAEMVLDDASAAFSAALLGSDDSLLVSRAHFGMARVAESLGKIDEAVEAYRQCIEANESEAMVEQAQRRIDALNNPQTKEFLTWFSEQDFRPADPSLPPSLPSEKTLPDFPELNLPQLGEKPDSENGDGKMKLEDGDGLGLPDDVEVPPAKPGDDQPVGEKSSDDQPDDEKSSDAEKPADDAAANASAESQTPATESGAAAETGQEPAPEPDATENTESSDSESSDSESSDSESSDSESGDSAAKDSESSDADKQ